MAGPSYLAAFDHAAQQLHQQAAFVACLRRIAAGDGLGRAQREIHALGEIAATRLPLLRPDRPRMWFGGVETPVVRQLCEAPVLVAYEDDATERVRRELVTCWEQAQAPPRVRSLWDELLRLRAQLAEIEGFPQPFAGLRLSRLPEMLPGHLDMAGLSSALLELRADYHAAARQLTGVFEQLLGACERLWQFQRRRAAADAATRAFRRQPAMSPQMVAELQVLGLTQLPQDRDRLRRHYRQIARRVHPDAPGGTTLAFQRLTQAYQKVLALYS